MGFFFLYKFLFLLFLPSLVSIKKISQTLKTVFDHISKHLEERQKYSAKLLIFNSQLGVWNCGQTRSFVFDILHLKRKRSTNIRDNLT